jgi:hypothetical protein
MKKRDEKLKVAEISATIASFFLIASSLFISNANSSFSQLTQLNLFQIQNWGILTETDKTSIITQKLILVEDVSNSEKIGTLILFLGLSLIIFSFYILVTLTEKIMKKLLIVILIFVILITSYLIYLFVPLFKSFL